jgi:hypothetical protein
MFADLGAKRLGNIKQNVRSITGWSAIAAVCRLVLVTTLGVAVSPSAWSFACTWSPHEDAVAGTSSKPDCEALPKRACRRGEPRIETLTQTIAGGDGRWLHLQASSPIDQLAVRINGRLVKPLYVDDPSLGGLFVVDGQVGCPVHVGIHAHGKYANSDCAAVDVVAPWFEEIAVKAGVRVLHNGDDLEGEEFPVSTGIAIGDFDGDGWLDVFVANFGLPGQLFRNLGRTGKGAMAFEDVTVPAGIDGIFRGASAVFADIDNDGDKDLFVGRDGVDRLLENQLHETGTATFVDATHKWRLDAPGAGGNPNRRTAGAVFGDYDGDGRVDLYLSTHESRLNETAFMPQDRLFWNAGSYFVEVTHLLQAPGAPEERASFAAMWLDVDDDGDPDLIVSSDHDSFGIASYSRPGTVWLNEGPTRSGADGRQWQFRDVGKDSGFALYPDGKGQGLNAMGLDVGDVDGDGVAEIAMSNIGPNVLMARQAKRNGIPQFQDRAARAGLARTWLAWHPKTPGTARRAAWHDMSVTWGIHLMDGDNDGDLDLFAAGGSPPAGPTVNPMFGRRPVPNSWFVNDGKGHFSESGQRAGLADMEAGMGTAVADLDRDGWLDLVVANYRGPLRIFRNRGATLWSDHQALSVTLEDSTGNRDALGAVVRVTDDRGRRQHCNYVQRPGLSGGTPPTCHIGLAGRAVAKVEIVWPDGRTDVVRTPVKSGRLHCKSLQ